MPDGKGGFQSKQSRSQGGVITVDTDPPSKIELRDPPAHTRHLAAINAHWVPEGSSNRPFEKRPLQFARQLRNASLSRLEGRMACEAIILPSLAYPLATAYMSDKEILGIQRTYMSAAARSCGFNGNTSRAVLFGPRELGGYGITDLAAAQCWAQLDLLLHHMRRNDQTANLIRISLRGFNYSVDWQSQFWKL